MRALALLVASALVLAGCGAPEERVGPVPDDAGVQEPRGDAPPAIGGSQQPPPAVTPSVPEFRNASSNGTESRLEPHVLVATIDHGLNVYHQLFYRPNRTVHPCTYLQDFPCTVRELPLSVGGDDVYAMRSADADLLAAMEPDVWYWIPGTAFVAVRCDEEALAADCLVPGANREHGTHTVSSLLMEEPEANVAFSTSGYPDFFNDEGIPIDIQWSSTGPLVPLPVTYAGVVQGPRFDFVDVEAAGNFAYPTTLSGQDARPSAILVGGAAPTEGEEAESQKVVDVVSYYCRPVADGHHATAMTEACGTSFAAPTVAGALAKVVLQTRRATGYVGGYDGGVLDPVAGLTAAGLRDAMNRTATYAPDDQYGTPGKHPVPLNPQAPWLQWGWGFYDAAVADGTLDLLAGADAPAKPPEAQAYMDAVYAFRSTYYGG